MKDLIERILNNNGVIILDTNVYLKIYERSPEFSEFSIEVLDKVKDYIIVPSTVKREFLKNHNSCFNKQYARVKNACNNLNDQLRSTQQKISNRCNEIKSLQFPDIDEIEEKISEKIKEALVIVDEYAENHDVLEVVNNASIKADSVYGLFNWLIENDKALEDLSADDIYSWTLSGDKRYLEKVPPGFKDTKKNKGLSKYGDYFIWEETLRYAKENNKPIIFVTDDMKIDWYEVENENKRFHSKLIEEFNRKAGTDFVGIPSLEFYRIISTMFDIKQTSGVVYALNYTAQQYINALVQDEIICDHISDLIYNSEEYVDMDSLSASASEGIQINEDIDTEFVDFEIYDLSDDYAIYNLRYKVSADAISHEYWGRDDDTKEVIPSPGRIHHLEGEVVLQVYRDVDPLMFIEDDTSYSDARLISGELKEVSAYNVDELCVQCRENIGIYKNYYEEPICEHCMVLDKYGEICTYCGRKVPQELMATDNACVDCANKYNL